ncbi:MAG: hypothetical protein ABJL57_10620 [Hyphomonas sp.]|uniref:hypothetical protein n=1 Tax=Hyphomonas sp. TaxID=87 RepID=UPI0032655A3D
MILFMTLAALLIAFSAFCTFGVPYMLAGPRMLEDFADNREQQMMAGLLGTAIIALFLLPFVSPALISSPTGGQVLADLYMGQIQA